ncbi:hypothetical protein, conserved [Trypanosoma cruzi]|uniref:PX domain-containing protein n=1 Tax=Trypanosoma cruzi (strain CL Brener) TaxID=353153 RepID=Q4DJ38_TRYCC|nr:hypothetical protein, conserved [Trypanosoma cruzi]EAN92538.1 hypothetical protein, conserved [Trypanosoma cruzi]|eukprot:XP_814389.1 hypothetical protein [Trypanosoma cruzi strain CL Brener]
MLLSTADSTMGPSSAGSEKMFQERQQEQSTVSQTQCTSPMPADTTPLARFVVEAAVLGTGLVRPITFFPIMMTIRSTSSSKYTVPDVPRGPHEKHMDTGIQRGQWAVSSSAQVDRRYSELVEFRTLLAYQFPTMIVPPLPPKSKLENFGTFLTNGNILLTQQRTLVRFLREVAMSPELMYFSMYTPNFFQLPRESFEDWIGIMRAALAEFRRCNSSIDAHSMRKGGLLGSESVAAFTGGSTTVVRKLVGMLHSWMGSGGESPKAPPKQQQSQRQSVSAVVGAGVLNATEDLNYWTGQMRFLEEYREALLGAARPYLTVMEQSLEIVVATKEVAEALEKYADALGTSSVNKELARVTLEASRFIGEGAIAMDRHQAKKKNEVYERLLFEVSYIDAAMDAIDHVICLWRHRNEVAGEQVGAEFTIYTSEVSNKLRNFYKNRFLRNFKLRMQSMLHRMTDAECRFAEEVEESMKGTTFARRIQNPKYSEYVHGPSSSSSTS